MPDPQTIDESKQAKLRKEQEAADNQERADLQRVLAQPEGRRVMYRILEMTGCGVINADPQRVTKDGSADTHHTYCEIGEQRFAERLKLDMLTLAPELFQLMMNEASTRIAEQIRLEAAKGKKTTDDDAEEENDDVES